MRRKSNRGMEMARTETRGMLAGAQRDCGSGCADPDSRRTVAAMFGAKIQGCKCLERDPAAAERSELRPSLREQLCLAYQRGPVRTEESHKLPCLTGRYAGFGNKSGCQRSALSPFIRSIGSH